MPVGVEYAAGIDRLAAVTRSRLFEMSYTPLQFRLFGLDEAG